MADEPIYLPPKLRDGQSCVVHAMDVRTSGIRELYRTQDILLKSPNWLASGHLPLHGESHLWRLSPDAARIVRVDSQSGLPKVNDNGREIQWRTTHDQCERWSPDGGQFAFVSYPFENEAGWPCVLILQTPIGNEGLHHEW